MSARAHLPRPAPGRRVAPHVAAALAVMLAVATPGVLAAANVAAAPSSPPRSEPATCDQAGARTEADLNLPPGLLRAIGRVESGRRDPATGVFAPWPWTINAAGQGRFFTDAASAAAAVRTPQAAGTASIDIGCFQVNLFHHLRAFRQLEEGFDPAANAAYAGAFLRSLHQRLGSWEAAVAAYHSATTERGDAYRARVFAAWNPSGAALPVPRAAAPAPSRRVGPVVIRISGPDLSAPEAAIRVWTPSRPGTGPARVAMPAPTVAAGIAALAQVDSPSP